MNMDEVFSTFLAESHEMLQDMERYLLELESGSQDTEQLNALFRCVHTIKGSAGLFGLDAVVAFTHVVENVLDRLRAGQVSLDVELAAVLLACRDHIDALIEGNGAEEHIQPIGQDLIHKLSRYQSSESQSRPAEAGERHAFSDEAGSKGTWHVSVRFGPDVLRQGMDPLGFLRYLATLGQLIRVTTLTDTLPEPQVLDPESCYLGFEIDLDAETDEASIEAVFEFVRDDCELRILPPDSSASASPGPDSHVSLALTEVFVSAESGAAEPAGVAADKQQRAREPRSQANQYVRVQADKLDALINLVGELVIATAAAGLSAQRHGDTATQEAMATVSGLVEAIRDGSLELRMVPIGETFQRFQRVVRDVSQELGKDIRLQISGADTELDKTVVEKIADPLTHLVRNAIDHGIESAERRILAGKPDEGCVRLNAFHDAGSVVIEVSDDGGGLNRAKILSKALERGVIQTSEGLSDTDIFQLIFEPGFSTADAVTNLSGRGVGMDVVKRSIEALRGTVEVDSIDGQGTTLRIRLPLTLAIIDGFLAGVGDASYVVPLKSVLECIELTAKQREETRRCNFINLHGEVLPVIRLRDHFGVNGEPGRRENVVVVSYGGNKAGLIVDVLVGEYQTVIKPLGRLFANLTGISGSTILGSGHVALILDVPALMHKVSHLEASSLKAGTTQSKDRCVITSKV